MMLSLLLSLALLAAASSFTLPSSLTLLHGTRNYKTVLCLNNGGNDSLDRTALLANIERRRFLLAGVAGAAAPFQSIDPAIAIDRKGPIIVIGANGRTGSECVGACLAQGIDVVATSRSGVYTGQRASPSLKTSVCDVTVPETIQSTVKQSSAVIFAASASKAGGTPAAVDNVGLVNVAKACIENKVPSLVIVSSGGVSKPDSPVYKFLNIFGHIMEEKIKGEDEVRSLYRGIDMSTCTYTVIRPGGLTEEPGRGASQLELNQGDTKSGRIARADVAALCVEAAAYPQLTGGTTFECYDADTAKPLQTVGLSNILKQTNKAGDSGDFESGKERQGNTYEELFTGLEVDTF